MPGPPRRLDAPDVMWSALGRGGDLPAGADELARDRDGHDAGRLATAVAQQLPAGVEPSLDAPGVVNERRVLAAALDGQGAERLQAAAALMAALESLLSPSN